MEAPLRVSGMEGSSAGWHSTRSIMGKSSSMNSFPSPDTPGLSGARTFLAVRIPDLVANSTTVSCSERTEVKRKCAEASVACPQSSTSAAGVNHRSWNRGAAPVAEESRRRKAVSERLNSAATDCNHRSSAALAASSRRHTAAGLPLNGSAVKASTTAYWIGFLVIAPRNELRSFPGLWPPPAAASKFPCGIWSG
uniref:Uncharacterized protein n=1 Tax=Arundo donax TaxID=35708 RepID=A0A0A9H8M0_ARUDO